MTEVEWLEGSDPSPLLYYLMDIRGSQRKQRLFGCACCRRIWHLLVDQRSREAVESTEGWAEGVVSKDELWFFCEDANNAERGAATEPQRSAVIAATGISSDCWDPAEDTAADEAASWAADAAGWENGPTAGAPPTSWGVQRTSLWGTAEQAAYVMERSVQSELLRCIFGNPFRPVAVDHSWLQWNSGTVVALAQTAYDERHLPSGELDRQRLAILADALEDAGCNNPEILDHLRGPGPHVRGCWVVDLLLGKE